MFKDMVFWAIAATVMSGALSGAEPATPKAMAVALLSPGPISDAGWNATAYEGLKRIEKELGATIAQVETKTPSEFEENFRTFGEKKFDLVFGHGFEYQDPADQIHGEFPKTVFVVTAGVAARPPNVIPLLIVLEEPAYLAGFLAGKLTKSGVAGCVGGMELPGVKTSFEGFAAGFQAARKGGQVLTAYVGNWEDAGAAKEAAKAQISKGADFLFHNADAAGLGVFRACREAKGRPVFAFGSNKDQNAVMPDVILASAVVDIPQAMLAVAKNLRAGTFAPNPVRIALGNGQARLVINPALAGTVGAELRQELERVSADVAAGRVKLTK